MNNTLPIDIKQNITMRIGADPIARKGGVPYRSVIEALLSDTDPHPIVVDITSGHNSPGYSYSEAKIRLFEDQKRYLAVRIRYPKPLGVFTPKEGRFVIDSRSLPAENIKMYWGDQYMLEPNWRVDVTVPAGILMKS